MAAFVLNTAACGSRLDLGFDDAGKPDAGDCRVGTYAGKFSCTISMAGASLPSALTGGDMTLVVDFPDAAAPPGTLVLTSASGLASSGAGVTSHGVLTGVLDCPARTFFALLSDVKFDSPSAGFTSMLTGSGTLNAQYEPYDPDAGAPAFVNGILVPPTVGGSGTMQFCTWSAALR